MLGSPELTNYDLRFRLLDIPVRVHPFFWLVTAMIGGSQPLRLTLIFVACVFVSILVHEYGHGLSSRWLGGEPTEIVLHSMGGLCFSDRARLSPLSNILVIAAGPGAGFLLFGFVLAFLNARYGIQAWDALAFINIGNGNPMEVVARLEGSNTALHVVHYMLWINLFWGLFNLLPIWPLDGGQISATFLGTLFPRDGVRWAHVIALMISGGVAMWALSQKDYFLALFVAYFAMINFQILHSMHDSYRPNRDSSWGR